MPERARRVFLAALVALQASLGGAATLPIGFAESLVASGLSSPTAMAFAPDGRLFVCEQGGRLRVVKNGALLATPFVTLTVDSPGERGLLGVAFDPAFTTNGYVYVYYTATTPAVHNRLSRFTAAGDVAVPGSEAILLELDNLSGATNHNGGAIHFGPDGMLYVAVGDNATGSNAQTLANLHGKVLRLHADGTIPTDNPFYAAATGKNRAIWALGLRNPFTFAFHRVSGRMFVNDVGQSAWEEINDGIVGSNYGWPATEGATANPAYRSPLFAYGHVGGTSGGCAITGGAFYDAAVRPFPAGYHDTYFFADYCNNWIRAFDPATGTAAVFATGVSSPVDLKVQPDGSLYYLARGASAVYRVQYTAGLAPTIAAHPQNASVPVGAPATFTVSASGTPPLAYQWQRDGADLPGATAAGYTLAAAALADDGALFRCVVTNAFGSATSNPARLGVTPDLAPTAVITLPAPGALYTAGETLAFAGSASDPEEGALPPSAFTWQIDFHHDAHTHPFLPPTSGVASGSVVIPTAGETSASVFYRVHLVVRDSAGNTHAVFQDVLPRTAAVRIDSVPPGLELRLDGQPATAPIVFTGVAGLLRELEAPSPQVVDGTTWVFDAWSDGGDRVHTIATPLADTSYTATFRPLATDEPVSWTRLLGVQATGNDLRMNAARGWGNAGAVSTKALVGDGAVELVASETTSARMFGLAAADVDQGWTTLDFALYLSPTAGLAVYEKGTYRGAVGAYAPGDLLRIALEADVVRYWNGGVLLYTSAAAPPPLLRVDSSLYTPGATLTDVVLQGAWAAPPDAAPTGTPVAWTNAVGVTATGSDLVKTAPTGWGNAGASSLQWLAAGAGYVEFRASEGTTSRMLGLAGFDLDQGWRTLDHAFYLRADQRLQIYERGVYRGYFGTYFPGDVLRVGVESGVVTYRRNGAVVYTSSGTPAYPLFVDTSLHATGATLEDVVVSTGWTEP